MYFLTFHIMQATLSQYHLDQVSNHINQTSLVEFLFTVSRDICHEYIEGAEPGTKIYQWIVFPHFCYIDTESLIEAKIPVINSDYGCWVGVTSCGSNYDAYFYPKLIQALWGVECCFEDIIKLRCG